MHKSKFITFRNSTLIRKQQSATRASEDAAALVTEAVLAQADADADADQDVVTEGAAKNENWKEVYFTKMNTVPYKKENGGNGVKTFYACNIKEGGIPCNRDEDKPIPQTDHTAQGKGSTGKLTAHLRNGGKEHKAAFDVVSSKNQSGKFQCKCETGAPTRTVHTHSEAFDHHVQFVKLCAAEGRPWALGDGLHSSESLSVASTASMFRLLRSCAGSFCEA